MIHSKFPVLLLTVCLVFGPPVLAGVGNTMQDELRIFGEEIAVQCTSVKEQLEAFKVRADPLTGYNLKDAVQSLCHCLPEKTQAFKSTLTAEVLARPVTVEEYTSRFNPAVIDKCATEQMRNMYGDECHKRFRKSGIDVPAYCACMKHVVSGYSDDTAAAISAAASEYLPQAAEAEKNGQPSPARPPVLEAYFHADQDCKAKKFPAR